MFSCVKLNLQRKLLRCALRGGAVLTWFALISTDWCQGAAKEGMCVPAMSGGRMPAPWCEPGRDVERCEVADIGR